MSKFIEESEAEQQFNNMLDEVYGTVEIAGYTFDTSTSLSELDPIAWRTSFLDWLDAEDLTTDESEADTEEDDEEA